MDFGQTLRAAQRLQEQKSSDGLYYRAKFDPPKKEQKQKDKLSENIKKFLAKKEAEEKQKVLEEKRKREELMAKRDVKATNKIKKMLKVTKSANKSVLDDGNQWNDTAITLEGQEMPDQDDYGYESQEAAAYYKKMMEKYSKIPNEEKFPTSKSRAKSDVETTKERVRNALLHADDPKPRHRKKRENEKEAERKVSPEPEKKPEKPKPRRTLPPPIDFNQLLKLAEQKKSEPILLPVKKTTLEDSERPMTKKERQMFEEDKARREAQARRMQEANRKPNTKYESRHNNDRPSGEGRTNTSSSSNFTRIPKLGEKSNNKTTERNPVMNNNNKLATQSSKNNNMPAPKNLEPYSKSVQRREVPSNDGRSRYDPKSVNRIEKNPNLSNKKINRPDVKTENRPQLNPERRPQNVATSQSKAFSQNDKLSKSKQLMQSEANRMKKEIPKQQPINRKEVHSSSNNGQSRFEKSAGSFNFDRHISSLGKQENRNNVPQTSRQFPPGDVRRKANDMKKKPTKRRIVDSDSEYDSEFDDFIVDEDEEINFSEEIKNIFGYDKKRYAGVDDDDECMESNFVQQMREETISKRIGLQEDLEDMKMEREEMARKMKAKKRK